MNELKFLIDFEKYQIDKIKELVNSLVILEGEINEALIIINNLKIPENMEYADDFEKIGKESIIPILFLHLEQIFEINADYPSIHNSLILIKRIFPEPKDITNNIIDLTFFKKFNFPISFMSLILENFNSEIISYYKNVILFGSNYEKIHREKFTKKGFNYINYTKFIENKILNIMQFGTNFSNAKAVSVSTTYTFGRRGNK